MTDTVELKRKRLKFRSRHRGTKELDMILGAFAHDHLDAMSAEQIDRYEAILNADEHNIYLWLTGQAEVPAEYDNDVMAQLLNFDYTRSAP